MESKSTATKEPVAPIPEARPVPSPTGLSLSLALLLVAFAWPLIQLARFSYHSELYSYIILIPCVSAYIAWLRKDQILAPSPQYSRLVALCFLAAGAALLLTHSWLWLSSSTGRSQEDKLATTSLAFVLLLIAICVRFLGKSGVRALTFPLLFLLFIVPFPTWALRALETFMQHGSAAVAHALFDSAGTSVFYQNLIFQLPGINLHVAPECSGMRSTMALLIVSVVTGHLFLRRPLFRAFLVLVIIPLALLRNGFRIFVIGELCVRYGPEMIDSFIHRRGGPIFFALSLIPFFLLLLFFLKRERRTSR